MYIVCDADCQANRQCPTFCVTASYIWIKKGGICSFYTKRVAAQPAIDDMEEKLCSGIKSLDTLRFRAAGSGTGCISVSIEELNAIRDEIATQPVIEADAEKVPKCCADMKPDPLGYDCVCPICGRTA